MEATALEAAQQQAAQQRQAIETLHGTKVKPMFVPVVDKNGTITEFAIGWLKPMNKQILGQFMMLDRTNPLAAQEVVMRGLLIADKSDARILNETEHFDIFCNALNTLITSPAMGVYCGKVGE